MPSVYFLWMQFFTTEPFACEPSSLPKYPPSKEIDVKRRDEEARRFVTLPLISLLRMIQCHKLIYFEFAVTNLLIYKCML
jgi:hypothetical protein